MHPQQRDEVDISSLTEEEQKLYRLYGKLPTRKDLLANKLKVRALATDGKERKYFDSGDYALSKAGRAPKQSVGTTIPNPEMVPHAANAPGGTPPVQIPEQSTSPPAPGHAAPLGIPEKNGSSPTGGHGNRLSASLGTSPFGVSPSRSSFPTATGVHAGSPGREPTSSLARGSLDADNDMLEG